MINELRPSSPATEQEDLVLATGAWRPELGPGNRLFAEIGSLGLESGAVLEDVTVAYETWGTLDADGGNAVLVLHALTGDSHVIGAQTPPTRAPAGGRTSSVRADPSTPTAGSSSPPTSWAAVRAPPAPARPLPTAAPTAPASRSSPSATRSPPRRRCASGSGSRASPW